MPDLSSLPDVGFPLPAGATSVKVGSTASEPKKVDVTTLADTERKYDDVPLVDAGYDVQKQTVQVSFFGTAPEVNDNPQATGWICIDAETEYVVGDMVKGTATYVYKAP